MQTNIKKWGMSRGGVKDGVGHALKEYHGAVNMANPNSELGLANCETTIQIWEIFIRQHCHLKTCTEGLGKGRKGGG